MKVVGTDEQQVYNATKQLLDNDIVYNKMSHAMNPYGDGKASLRIVEHIKFYFGLLDKNLIILNNEKIALIYFVNIL